MTTQLTTSQVLLEDRSIAIRPGGEGDCPFCHQATFRVIHDDTLLSEEVQA